jgi:predicted PurR-regulated permease PerM
MSRSRTEAGNDTAADPMGGTRRSAAGSGLPGWVYGALIVVLAVWILHSFLEAMLVACVTAAASWPLYGRFTARLSRYLSQTALSLLFTALMAVFVLAPLLFGFLALLSEARALLLELAAADSKGIPVPPWLQDLPLIGARAVERWQAELAQPGALAGWAQRIDATTLLASAQYLGRFVAQQAFVVAFTILVLFFLYQEGKSLADGLRRLLRHRIGSRADGYLDLTVRALRSSVNSMLLVALFDGVACWAVFALAGVPRPLPWAAATGTLALVPFLGYLAVGALAMQLTMAGATAAALVAFALGGAVLFSGDKILRPMLAGEGTRLRFVWVLMGCLGGFEVLGPVGLVVGPVVLAITKELWEQRLRDLAAAEPPQASASVNSGASPAPSP